MGELIKGALVASHIRHQVRANVKALVETGVRPCLAVCIVGDDPASRIYVRRKQQACAAVGIRSVRTDLPASASTEDVLEVVRRWNADPSIHGILVQLPLPSQVNRAVVLDAIDPEKDVDGIGSTSIGRLAQGLPAFVPCTVAGIMELFKQYHVRTRGQQVVIVNRSVVVGVPLALLLSRDNDQGNATVTLVHEHTRNLTAILRRADIVITAVGRLSEFCLHGSMVKRGAVVIDVGVNRVGQRILGDVAFDEVAPKASLITPATGGVGPCTIAMLLKNTVAAAQAQSVTARPRTAEPAYLRGIA